MQVSRAATLDTVLNATAFTVSRLVEICGDPLPLYGDDKRRELPTTARTA